MHVIAPVMYFLLVFNHKMYDKTCTQNIRIQVISETIKYSANEFRFVIVCDEYGHYALTKTQAEQTVAL